VKNRFIIYCILFAFGCSSSKTAGSNPTGKDPQEKNGSFEFIEGISTEAPSQSNNLNTHRNTSFTGKQLNTGAPAYTSSIESYSPLRFKYAILLDVTVEDLSHIDLSLLRFIEEWYGTRYHYGGNNKEGIDCSAFANLLMSEVYNINTLPRSSQDQYDATARVPAEELREGDLVFFHTQKNAKHNEVTHVGVYLLNHKFVHASISGVMISDLSQGYYFHHYVGAGRIKW